MWQGCQVFWPLWLFKCCGLWLHWTVVTSVREYPLCNLSNVVAFGHNKLKFLNTSVKKQRFWGDNAFASYVVTTNCSGFQVQIASLWLIKCCNIWPQWSVANSNVLTFCLSLYPDLSQFPYLFSFFLCITVIIFLFFLSLPQKQSYFFILFISVLPSTTGFTSSFH